MMQTEVPAIGAKPTAGKESIGPDANAPTEQESPATPTKNAKNDTGKKQPPAINTDVNEATSRSAVTSATSQMSSRSEFRQAQTPKHCNKAAGSGVGKARIVGGSGPGQQTEGSGPSPSGPYAGYPTVYHAPHPHGTHIVHPAYGYPPHYYGPPATRGEGPPMSQQQKQRHPSYPGYSAPPQTVSPGSYRGGMVPPNHSHSSDHPLPPSHPGPVSGSRSWEQQQQHMQHQQFGGYPTPYPSHVAPFQGRPPHHPHRHQVVEQDAAAFSRTISSSFENPRSKASDDEKGDNSLSSSGSHNIVNNTGAVTATNKPAALSHDLHAYNNAQHRQQDAIKTANDEMSAGAQSDHSWGLLHTVQSVDEAQLKAANEAKQRDAAKASTVDDAEGKAGIGPAGKGNDAKINGPPSRDATSTPSDQIQADIAASELCNLGSASTLSHSPGQRKEHYIIPAPNKTYPPLPTPSKLAKLDSLSSVASVQEPLDTSGVDAPDLLQCNSGSSGSLLFPIQGPSSRYNHGDSLDHPIAPQDLIGSGSKRRREQRGDGEEQRCGLDEIRKAASSISEEETKGDSSKGRPCKKGKIGPDADKMTSDTRAKQEKDKASPLSIACTPPASPAPPKAKLPDAKLNPATGNAQPKLSQLTASPGTPGIPQYSFSIDSMPSFSKEVGKMGSFAGGLPPRPGSVNSIPLGLPKRASNTDHHEMPSWEIDGQGSFMGGMSVGSGGSGNGQGLFSSFSFTNDYHMLTQSGYPGGPLQEKDDTQQLRSQVAAQKLGTKVNQGMSAHQDSRLHPPIDRNSQVNGGIISRSGTFESAYSMSSLPTVPSWGSSGRQQLLTRSPGSTHYPPHAQSWSSNGSVGYGYPGYLRGQVYSQSQMPMSRTFTEDSSKSSSGYQNTGITNAFQPPLSEFAVPLQGPAGKRQPPTAVYLVPSAPGSAPEVKAVGSAPVSAQAAAAVQAASASAAAVAAQPPRVRKASVSKRHSANQKFNNWSKEEDDKLTEILKKYKSPRDWTPIAREHAMGKSAKECHERWIRYLKPGVRKGQWTDQEDSIVMEAVTTSTEQPFTRWSDLAQMLPGRVGKQIRDRWVNHLNPNINHMPFSREDDILLWNGHKKFGKRWVEISTKCFNSSRSENHIKNRWYSASFKKFIASEFGQEEYLASIGTPKKATPSNKPKGKKA